MNFSFHPEAEKEFVAAIDYYEEREENLGLDFAAEVYAAIGRAVEHPRAWPIVEDEVRRCQTIRFPYAVLYSQELDGIFILAVMHLHRHPDYWKDRRG
jgi:plasmid stabilization system protein ParE